jgi:hypothetical protein
VKNSKDCVEHLILSLFIITHPLGLANFFFGFYLLTLKDPKNRKQLTEKEATQKEHLRFISVFSRNCKFAECILQSIPQIALKSYNNYLTKNWDIIGIVSVTFSVASAIFSIVQTMIMLDKETRAIKKQVTKTEVLKIDQTGIIRQDKSDNSVYEDHRFFISS